MAKNLGLKQQLREATEDERAAIINGLPYETGFGKPPEHTRFQAGNNHGRRGRPKGSENFHTILARELDAQVEVNEGGKRRKLRKREVAVWKVVNKAMQGDLKAVTLCVQLEQKHGLSTIRPPAPFLDDQDRAALQRLADYLGPSPNSDVVKDAGGGTEVAVMEAKQSSEKAP